MLNPFLPEELEIIRAFGAVNREVLMLELRQALPDIYQPDTKRAVCSAIGKLADMTDEEFDVLGLEESFDVGRRTNERNIYR